MDIWIVQKMRDVGISIIHAGNNRRNCSAHKILPSSGVRKRRPKGEEKKSAKCILVFFVFLANRGQFAMVGTAKMFGPSLDKEISI